MVGMMMNNKSGKQTAVALGVMSLKLMPACCQLSYCEKLPLTNCMLAYLDGENPKPIK